MPKRKVRNIIFGTIIIFLVFSLSFIRRNYVVPILMYHSVSPDAKLENRLSVSVETFQRQMRFLKNHRYNVLPLEAIANLIKEDRKIPPKTVAITFDDGYRDSYIYGFPILRKYNLPATYFLIVNEIERDQGDRLSWDEIKVMQDAGIIAFGSHALGAEPLVNIKSEEKLKKEIFDSKKILEDRLGYPINAFSYPEGRFNAKIKQLVIAAGYKLAVATNPGKGFSHKDAFVLKRLRISETARNLFVFWIEASGFYTFIKEHRDD